MYCQSCGHVGPTKYVRFQSVIGAVILVYTRWVKGDLCRSCVKERFWEHMATCLTLGWWSIPSLFANPVVMLINLGYYVRAMSALSPRRQSRAGAYPAVDVTPN